MEFMIRSMKIADIPHVQKIAKESWNSTYEGIIPSSVQESFLKSAYSDEMLKRRLEQSFLFVALYDREIVGFANFSPIKKGGEAELGAIYLYPEYQGKGIGTALLKKGIESLEGVREIYINVEKDNRIGMAFYQAKGFIVVSEFDDPFDGHVLKNVRMVLKL